MRIERRFTRKGQSPYEGITSSSVPRKSRTRTARRSSVRTASRCPQQWSEFATDILAQKYFRKAGVPQVDTDGKPLLERGR